MKYDANDLDLILGACGYRRISNLHYAGHGVTLFALPSGTVVVSDLEYTRADGSVPTYTVSLFDVVRSHHDSKTTRSLLA